jgi:hypothetical protein
VTVRDYDEQEIREAFAAALGERALEDELAHELQSPEGIATAISIELAQHAVPEGPDREREVADGATACLCGLLVSARLPPVARGLAEHLADGIATVRSFGRHAIIARHCDLGAVAEVETALAGAIGRGRELPPSALRLFELGFAIGLAARPAN